MKTKIIFFAILSGIISINSCLFADSSETTKFVWQQKGPSGELGFTDTIFKENGINGVSSRFIARYETNVLMFFNPIENRYVEQDICLQRISLIHGKTFKIVYLSPWSLFDGGDSYDAVYNGKNKIITITWNERTIASLSEEELNNDSTSDLRGHVVQNEVVSEHAQEVTSKQKPMKLMWASAPPGGIFSLTDSLQTETGSHTMTSAFTVSRSYKFLMSFEGDKSFEHNSVTLTQLYLTHEETGKVVYATPWSLVENQQGWYNTKYSAKDKTITILWRNRIIAVLAEEELKKDTLPDLQEFVNDTSTEKIK